MGLDLSGIEAWTRELLDDVARKRGIRNPEFRRRGELVRLLLRQHYGLRLQAGRERVARGVHAASQVRDLLSKLVSSAFEGLPPPVVSALEVRPDVEVRSSPAAPVPAQPERPPPEPAAQAAPAATTRTFQEGPARTRSVARALAASGYTERAMQVYAELIAAAGDDSALAAEAATVRRGDPAPAPLAAASVEVPRSRSKQLPPTDDRLSCEAAPGGGYSLRWQISEAGVRRARAVLGSAGQLTARLISIERDPELVVCSSIVEHGPLPRTGEWHSPRLRPHHRCLAAVGLLAGTRFVAIVHAQPRVHADEQRTHAVSAT
jgi:hypothetical protein